MSMYYIVPVELPASPPQLAAYKALRLASLQIDPQTFGSNYAREVAFPDSVWQERLGSPFQRTFIACVQDTLHAGEQGNINTAPAEQTGEWIGTASVVGGPDLHPSVHASFKEAGMGANWEAYALYGMWVHPTHRGKGIGTQLVKACLEWARRNGGIKSSNGETLEKVVVLLVYDNNIPGRALYSRMGFTDVEGVSVTEGERWMLARV